MNPGTLEAVAGFDPIGENRNEGRASLLIVVVPQGSSRVNVAWQVIVLTLGGACGVNARYWSSRVLAHWLGTAFPWATLLINLSGSFLIGLAAVLLAERWPSPLFRIFVMTGFLGGYTTFSAYMFETFTLWEKGDRSLALGNLVGSSLAGLMAVVLGVTLGRWLVEPELSSARTAEVEHRIEKISDLLAGESSTNDSSRTKPS